MARRIKHLILLVLSALVGAALVASPAGAAPTWQPVTTMFADLSATGGSAHTPALAVDPQGNAFALWSRYNGTQFVVQASQRPVGRSWSAPVDLAAARVAFDPQVVVDPAGNATAVWRLSETSTSVVQSATVPVGGTWTPAVDISVDTSVDQYERTDVPRVAVDAAGVATATWSRYDGSRHVVQSASRAPGGTWSAPTDVSVPGQSARTPQVAVDAVGNATVVWVADGRVQSATRPAGGAWSAPTDLSTASLFVSNPRVVVDSSGTATAVWNRLNGTAYAIQSATRPLGGTWSAPVDLSAPGEDTFDTIQVAVGPEDSLIAVWQRHDGTSWVVTSATRAAGGAWTRSVDVSESGRDTWDPQIAIDAAGNATAVWAVSVEDSWQRRVEAARRPAGGSWSAPVDLPPGGGNAMNPRIVLDPAGNATTAWSRHDGTNWVVQVRGLDAAGPVVTDLTSRSAGKRGKNVYSVRAHDVWSEVASATWDFGDGTTASGASVTHAAGRASTRPVRVTLTDAVGNATLCTYTGTYTCRATTRVAPAITRASLTRHKIRAVGSRSKVAKKADATVVLTNAGKVTLAFRKAGTKRSIRLTDRREAGENAFTIRARLAKGKALSPGRYTVTITATNTFGTSKKKRLRLRVVR